MRALSPVLLRPRWSFAPILVSLCVLSCDERVRVPEPSCTTEGLLCASGRAIQCNADGTADSIDDCIGRSLRCDSTLGCVECTAFGQRQCVGQTVVTCSAEGTITGSEDCFASGLVCGGPTLGCSTCVPRSGSCIGGNPQVCNAAGTGWDPGAPCPAGLDCDANDGQCKDLCAQAVETKSYIGCDYWATTTANGVDQEFDYALVISNPQAVDATVTISLGAMSDTYIVAAGAVETIRLPWLRPVVPYREVSDGVYERASILEAVGAYHVVSTVPVTVYQFSPLDYRLDRDCEAETTAPDGRCFSFSNDASLLLPTHVLSGEYLVISRATQQQKREAFDGAGGRLTFGDAEVLHSSTPGFVAIIGAGERPVEVTVTSTAHTHGGDGIIAMRPGESQTFQLAPGAVVELVTATPPDSSCTGSVDSQTVTCPAGTPGPCRIQWTFCEVDTSYDLTGTRIHADGPVAVFAGHQCAFVPDDRLACDHLEESMFPLQAWGTHVIASVTEPLRSEPNVFRVVSGEDGNTISFHPPVRPEVTLRAGAFVEFEATDDFAITGTGPIAVGQFLVGQDYTGLGTSGPEDAGDPSFSLAIPVEQYRTSYSFLAPHTYEESWVTIVAPIGHAVFLDGTRVGGWRVVEGTEFQTARIRITGGAHEMRSDQPFGVSVYGFGSYTSYMYPAGLDFRFIYLI